MAKMVLAFWLAATYVPLTHPQASTYTHTLPYNPDFPILEFGVRSPERVHETCNYKINDFQVAQSDVAIWERVSQEDEEERTNNGQDNMAQGGWSG